MTMLILAPLQPSTSFLHWSHRIGSEWVSRGVSARCECTQIIVMFVYLVAIPVCETWYLGTEQEQSMRKLQMSSEIL